MVGNHFPSYNDMIPEDEMYLPLYLLHNQSGELQFCNYQFYVCYFFIILISEVAL